MSGATLWHGSPPPLSAAPKRGRPLNRLREQAVSAVVLGNSSIGEVFTPDFLCEWILERSGIVQAFLDGATIIDPTCGDGAFLRALVRIARKTKKIRGPDLARLTGVELSKMNLDNFRFKFRKEFPELPFQSVNTIRADFFDWQDPQRFDIFVGNPPWLNFADLPQNYKPRIKRAFDELKLVPNRRALLLGSSRVDISAAVIAKMVSQHLARHGRGVFLCPFSLFLNDGAHEGFRDFLGKKINVISLEELSRTKIFESISTKYGVCSFAAPGPTEFPIPYYDRGSFGELAEELVAEPFNESGGPWRVRKPGGTRPSIPNFTHDQKPRQGVNTCGANGVFIGEIHSWDAEAPIQRMTFSDFGVIPLPTEFLFPLLTKECFGAAPFSPRKFILIPHNRSTGRPLEWSDISAHPEMMSFLQKNQFALQARKGQLINGWIQRGYWWALLGVGAYSFSKHKIAWQAFGTRRMRARIFGLFHGQHWQGNQALHAFIPSSSKSKAEAVRKFLNSKAVQLHLESHLAQGTKNWAQPGKISRLFTISQR